MFPERNTVCQEVSPLMDQQHHDSDASVIVFRTGYKKCRRPAAESVRRKQMRVREAKRTRGDPVGRERQVCRRMRQQV